MKDKARFSNIERWLVILISLHSLAVGMLLLLLPRWSAAFGGWGGVEPRFFIRQAGVFHLVVAAGYLLEYGRHRGVGLLLLAKSAAVVFLLSSSVAGGAPWAVPLSAAGDAVMALAVALVHARAAGDARAQEGSVVTAGSAAPRRDGDPPRMRRGRGDQA